MFELSGKATLIGSFPFEDHSQALDLILKYTPEIPCWPQLPRRKEEGMLVQFSRGLPGFDPEGLLLNPEGSEEEKLAFYEEYLAVTQGHPLEETRFKLYPEEAPGFFLLLKAGKPFPAVKGQITGPFTLALGLKLPDGRAAFYDLEARDMITKLVALKARWQIEKLKTLSETVLLFIDEPALSGFGSSAMVGISPEEVLGLIKEVAEEVHRGGGLLGIHICGNSDWALVAESAVDIINFDAYGFAEKFIGYGPQLKPFLKRGGFIAWGLVPTLQKKDLKELTSQELKLRYQDLREKLAQATHLPEEEIERFSLFTPSCGLGTLSQELTIKALELLKDLVFKS